MTPRHDPAPALFGLLAALTAGTLAVPPMAQAGEVRRVAVAYHDLDLNDPVARVTLEHRVTAAARTLCGEPAPIANPRRCVSTALREARPQIERVVARRVAAIMVSTGVPSARADR